MDAEVRQRVLTMMVGKRLFLIGERRYIEIEEDGVMNEPCYPRLYDSFRDHFEASEIGSFVSADTKIKTIGPVDLDIQETRTSHS